MCDRTWSQAADNGGAVPSYLTVAAPSYAVTGTYLSVNISYSNYSPPPPPPAATPSKCGGTKTSFWLGITGQVLVIGAAVATGGAHKCGRFGDRVRLPSSRGSSAPEETRNPTPSRLSSHSFYL
jgi:hypothetical protein